MTLCIVTSLYRSDKHLASFLRHAVKVHAGLRRHGIVFEHLLIINDPTDTERKLSAHLSPPFRVIVVPREPIYATWNRGIQETTAPIITFWGVDDIRFVTALLRGIEAIGKGFDAVYFPFIYLRYIRAMGFKLLAKIWVFSPPRYNPERFKTEMHAGPHFMAHRRAFDTNGCFDETFTIAGDFDWWSRFAGTHLKACRIGAISGIFTNDGTTLSGSRSRKQANENESVMSRAHE